MRKDSSGRGANVRQRAGSLTPARRLAGLAAVAVALLSLALPTVARADMEESEEAPVRVEQAIALIANDTGPARVAERIDDTLKAPRKEGVDLALVGRALAVVEHPGQHKAALGEARALLVHSLGGKLPSAPQPGRFATGTETGTSVVLDEFRPARGIADAGDVALLALALAAVAFGPWLSVRLRPLTASGNSSADPPRRRAEVDPPTRPHRPPRPRRGGPTVAGAPLPRGAPGAGSGRSPLLPSSRRACSTRGLRSAPSPGTGLLVLVSALVLAASAIQAARIAAVLAAPPRLPAWRRTPGTQPTHRGGHERRWEG